MNKPDDPRWSATRAGARAGRGFRYQDAVAAFLLVDQWAKGASAKIVPEGLDDLNLFVGTVETRIQAKSMHDPKGSFRISQLAEYLDKSAIERERVADRIRWQSRLLAFGWQLQTECGWQSATN